MNNVPGLTAAAFTDEVQLFETGPDNNHRWFDTPLTIKSTVTDSGNTPTTTLRPGTVMSVKDSDSLGYYYAGGANDGTQNARGIISQQTGFTMLESLLNPTAVNKFTHVRQGGILKGLSTSYLPNVDNAAAASLLRNGFIGAGLDPHGSAFGLHFKSRYFKTADYTVLTTDHGKMFIAATNAVNFTLPTIADAGRGFQVFFYNSVDANMVITAAANTIVYGDAGGALSTTLTFSTANKKMGGNALIYADYLVDGTTLAWYVITSTAPTSA